MAGVMQTVITPFGAEDITTGRSITLILPYIALNSTKLVTP